MVSEYFLTRYILSYVCFGDIVVTTYLLLVFCVIWFVLAFLSSYRDFFVLVEPAFDSTPWWVLYGPDRPAFDNSFYLDIVLYNIS